MTLNLVNWNVGWAETKKRRPEIRERIECHTPEIICLTEGHCDLLSQEGHTICSHPDEDTIKKGLEDERRKVLLWSKHSWDQVDDLGSESLRTGRFVSGVTETSIGEVMVIGVCIPWMNSPGIKGSGVKYGQHHEQYLHLLQGVLKEARERALGKCLIITGDFNQRLGPKSKSSSGRRAQLRSMLENALPPYMVIATKDLKFQKKRGVDHRALSDDLTANAFINYLKT